MCLRLKNITICSFDSHRWWWAEWRGRPPPVPASEPPACWQPPRPGWRCRRRSGGRAPWPGAAGARTGPGRRGAARGCAASSPSSCRIGCPGSSPASASRYPPSLAAPPAQQWKIIVLKSVFCGSRSGLFLQCCGSGIRELRKIFGLKILKLFNVDAESLWSWIRDGTIRIRNTQHYFFIMNPDTTEPNLDPDFLMPEISIYFRGSKQSRR